MWSDERRAPFRRRYLSLGTGEIAAAAAFVSVAVLAIQPLLKSRGEYLALWAGLLPLLIVLVQAGIYWLLARSWVGGGRMPRGIAAVYRALRILDAVLLGVSLLALIWVAPLRPGVLVLGGAVWLFAAAEYVNYFHVRLAYPWPRWFRSVRRWRAPRLLLDIREAETSRFA